MSERDVLSSQSANAGRFPARRQVGLFTSGRQDWGILEPVARAVATHPALELTVFISGTHLLEMFGNTARLVRIYGFRCLDVPLWDSVESPDGVVRAADIAGMSGRLAAAMQANAIDVMVVLGDRVETLAASLTVVADRRFLAHIHGGDRAPGEFDDSCRHAITKLAHIHFPATSAAAERIAHMGEPADRIHIVGSPSIDGVLAGGMAGEDQARAAVGLAPGQPYALVLYHPAGLGDAAEAAAAEAVAQAMLDAGLTAVVVGPNSDPGRAAIWDTLTRFSHAHNWPILATSARPVFLRLMHDAVALVGNSSAGMVESAAVGAAVVNVGPRQQGREHSANVVNVPAQRLAVAAVLRRLQTDAQFARQLRSAPCVFGDGRAGQRIAEVLAAANLSPPRRIKLNQY